MSIITTTCLEEGIFELKMNDLVNKNRFTDKFVQALLEELTRLSEEKSIKVLILSGQPTVFCAGASLEELKKLASYQLTVKHLAILPKAILDFPVPVIAALEGHAIGGGFILALCCDVIVASETSRYGANFTNMGFTPGMGTTTLLPTLVGHHFASEMILTAKLYKGKELKTRGLFNYIVSSEDVIPVVLDIARQIAEKPKHVLELLKDTLSLNRRKNLQEAITQEQLMHRICFGNRDTINSIENAYLK